jgi:hypothetical protein
MNSASGATKKATAASAKRRKSRPLRTVSDLLPDPLNANQGNAAGRSLLETSVRRYGFGRSVVADKHGRLIAGNKTVDASRQLGDPKVIVVPTRGEELVVVQRTDLDIETDVEAMELAVADNRTAELGIEWNPKVLEALAGKGLDPRQFWRAEEWEAIIAAGVELTPAAEVPGMALQPFEEYNYLLVMFKNSQDWQGACDRIGVRRESIVLGGARKVGLGRVLDGAKLLELLCASPSSSRVANASTRSKPTRSRSSPKRRSVSRRAKRPPTAPSPDGSSSIPTTS